MNLLTRALFFLVLTTVHIQANADLTENSPFGFNESAQMQQEAYTAAEEVCIKEQFFLKGLVKLSGEYHFSIFDGVSRKSSWLVLNDQFNNIRLVSYDKNTQLLTVEDSGTITTLKLSAGQGLDLSLSSQTSSSINLPEPIRGISRRPIAFRVEKMRDLVFNNQKNLRNDANSDESFNAGYNNDQFNLNNNTDRSRLNTASADNNLSLIVPDTTYSHRFGINKNRITLPLPIDN
ncbi:MAG: hypothetical protein ACJAYS_000407 [Lentimonas sp.]|jgi:hypothetical protein